MQVLRSILAIIVGYAAMVAPVMAYFLIAYGGDPDARPNSGQMGLSMALGLPGALAGGYLLGWIAGRRITTHALVLAGLVFIMGIAYFIGPSEEPAWYKLVNLILGPLGLLTGAEVRRRTAAALP